MLTGLLGMRLILLLGKTIPTPAPYSATTALRHVKVTNSTDGDDGFQMTFSLGKDKAMDYGLLSSGVLDPDTRVLIGVLLGASLEPLIDGVIYHHQVRPSNEPGMSTLTVTGRDVTATLDLEEKNEPYKNQPDSLIATQVILRNTKTGLVPRVTPTVEIPIEIDRIPRQNETDLAFLRRLAKRNGFVFYLEPLTLGTNTAHWGPASRVGTLQPAMNMNLGAHSNVAKLDFTEDALAPVEVKGSFIEPISKRSIRIPVLPSLLVPPLAPIPTKARRKKLMRSTANKNPGQAALSALAGLMNAPDSVDASGQVDTLRYGHILRARRLVGVCGAGFSYDGIYQVKSVTHEIERGNYTQEFKLAREGTGALLPLLPQ